MQTGTPFAATGTIYLDAESQRPECDRKDDCRITDAGAVSTLVYYPPILDGHGRNTNPDRNTTTHYRSCSTCGKRWTEIT